MVKCGNENSLCRNEDYRFLTHEKSFGLDSVDVAPIFPNKSCRNIILMLSDT